MQQSLTNFLKDRTLWSSTVTGTGPVYRLERHFESLYGENYYILSLSNATMALWAALSALNIYEAEVITTPYTWGGSIAGIIKNGNQPVFADICPENLTLDAKQAAKAVTSKTRAILAVDIYGQPCDGRGLGDLADTHRLYLIQDCASSFGALTSEGRPTGVWADVAVFSLGWNKALYAGEGALLVTQHEHLYQTLVAGTQHPMRMQRDLEPNRISEFGLNLRINPLAALVAEVTFQEALNALAEHRERAKKVLALLKNGGFIKQAPAQETLTGAAFQPLTVEPYKEKACLIKPYLQNHGYNCAVDRAAVQKPLYHHEAYLKIARVRQWPMPTCPIAEQQAANRLALKLKP